MQFVKGGPDIPKRLLQAHEKERVVFFCGAGISCPSGLPDFECLVKRLYLYYGIDRDPTLNAKPFDAEIDWLEQNIVGGRDSVRRELAKILSSAPNSNTNSVHKDLLTLATSSEGRSRLVTTNFDRLFEEAIAAGNRSIDSHQAPRLPMLEKCWEGLVYLHGRLPGEKKSKAPDHLVLSSGDFGVAYLTERWAARFVSELLRNHHVCFVGYGINDPMLRYALAADRLRGESSLEMFAFGGYSDESERVAKANEWKAKNVTPILYRKQEAELDDKYHGHFFLYETLREWAKIHRDGLRGKERIVVDIAKKQPSATDKCDIDRMLWALSDPSGLPAKRFANSNPAPSLDWLDVFPDSDFCESDHLTDWLVRHLDDPKLLLWMVNHRICSRHKLAQKIDWWISRLARFEREGDKKLAQIRANAPMAIPCRSMRVLWRLFLIGRIKKARNPCDYDYYNWQYRFAQDGLTAGSRLELREMLAPMVFLSEPRLELREMLASMMPLNERKRLEGEINREPKRVNELVDSEITLSAGDIHYCLPGNNNEHWIKASPKLLPEFTSLLRDALDLLRDLGEADDKKDLSFYDQPSIAEHPQNKRFRAWTALIDVTRDAWLATSTQSPERARIEAGVWQRMPYPLFRRLAFFAAAHSEVIPRRQALDWLLADDNWWLWESATRREALRLLVALAPKIDKDELSILEQAVLAGPPRAMYRDDLELDQWAGIVDCGIWLRLAKIAHAGATLSPTAAKKLNELSESNPQWEIAKDERDEFSSWMEISWGGEQDFASVPRRRRDLVEWLKRPPDVNERSRHDGWRDQCRKTPSVAACALIALAKEGVWSPLIYARWSEALQAWSRDKPIRSPWRYVGPILAAAPDEALRHLAHAIGWWLREIAKDFSGREECFFALAKRILTVEHQDGVFNDETVMHAINHPVGQITEALLIRWHRNPLKEGQGLPDSFKSIFTDLCLTKIEKYRHGRVLLASRVVTLFRVDRKWTEEKLLPLFDWRNETEACAAWVGFLWSPGLYLPLWRVDAFRRGFLDAARHYESLGEHGGQYASVLTIVALDSRDTFTGEELRGAIHQLPVSGLECASRKLVDALQEAGERRDNYWKNRVVPYLRYIWPQTRDKTSSLIEENFGYLCIAARDAFPDALRCLSAWLTRGDSDLLVRRLHKANLCAQFPEESLDFLDKVVDDKRGWSPNNLADCLHSIRGKKSALANDSRFKRLTNFLRRHGGWQE